MRLVEVLKAFRNNFFLDYTVIQRFRPKQLLELNSFFNRIMRQIMYIKDAGIYSLVALSAFPSPKPAAHLRQIANISRHGQTS